MASLPPLTEEDVRAIDSALDELLNRSEATAALIIDQGGPLLTQRGQVGQIDTTTVAALAAGSYSATQAIAERVGEVAFNCIYQQGAQSSLLVTRIDENLLLVVIFKASLSVGVVKFFAKGAIFHVEEQLTIARKRAPGAHMDLVGMETVDNPVFQKGSMPASTK
jgi:predicted regulator of Ras-like GTPase activity (Roadblock/LC7/MglB family)